MFQCDTIDRARFLQRNEKKAGEKVADHINPHELCFIRNTP